jgi:transposase, IS5 family
MKRRPFASLSFESKKKPTRRERFLGEMDKVVPWEALLALIEPSYPRSGRRGRPPMPAATMLRIHFMQQWRSQSRAFGWFIISLKAGCQVGSRRCGR